MPYIGRNVLDVLDGIVCLLIGPARSVGGGVLDGVDITAKRVPDALLLAVPGLVGAVVGTFYRWTLLAVGKGEREGKSRQSGEQGTQRTDGAGGISGLLGKVGVVVAVVAVVVVAAVRIVGVVVAVVVVAVVVIAVPVVGHGGLLLLLVYGGTGGGKAGELGSRIVWGYR